MNNKLDYQALLEEALNQPGQLSGCYRMFHNYSFQNQLLALIQCGVQPINTYKGWQALGRQVKKGAKAIELCMPVFIKEDKTDPDSEEKMVFIFRRNWFPMDRTDGEDAPAPEAIPFEKQRVLDALKVKDLKFETLNGNVQGYATKEGVAINPVAKYPLKTLFHELGHFVLGHVGSDDKSLTRSAAEVEAETVAYILCNVFNYLEPLEECRGYIQNWKDAEGDIGKDSARRIFKAVSAILKANNAVAEGSV